MKKVVSKQKQRELVLNQLVENIVNDGDDSVIDRFDTSGHKRIPKAQYALKKLNEFVDAINKLSYYDQRLDFEREIAMLRHTKSVLTQLSNKRFEW